MHPRFGDWSKAPWLTPSGPSSKAAARICRNEGDRGVGGYGLLGDERGPLGGRCLEVGHEVIYAPVDPIVEKYGWNGGGQPDRRGDQRFAYGWGDYGQAGGLGRSYSNERVHDPIDRPEESDERGACGAEGQEPHERAGSLALDKDRAVCHGLKSIEMGAR